MTEAAGSNHKGFPQAIQIRFGLDTRWTQDKPMRILLQQTEMEWQRLYTQASQMLRIARIRPACRSPGNIGGGTNWRYRGQPGCW